MKLKTSQGNPSHQYQHQHACNKQVKSINSTICTDSFYQVNLSPNLPVYISLRWNAAHPVRSVMRNPLYKYWPSYKQPDPKSPWSLVPMSPQETVLQHMNSYHHNNNLHHKVYLNSNPAISLACCPIHAATWHLIDAIRRDQMRYAVDFLLQIRGHIQCNAELPLTIKQSFTPLISSSMTQLVSDQVDGGEIKSTTVKNLQTSQTQTLQRRQQQQEQSTQTIDSRVTRNRNQRPLCGDIKSCAACLEDSLYRELLFLAIQALSRMSLDLISFDEQYSQVYRALRSSGPTLLTDFDLPPTPTASACRQMLRPLTLRP
ncbi:unnamed protein product [Heterobilharzia americana]|nr:unnamed protein product [Heterobilharzia americana]